MRARTLRLWSGEGRRRPELATRAGLMHRGPGPVFRPGDQPVADRIKPAVVQMGGQILRVAQVVFPIPALPEAAFVPPEV